MSNQKIMNSSVVKAQLRSDIPFFRVGSIVTVYYRIIEKTEKGGAKERIQAFKGIVINMHEKKSINATFSVLKVSAGAVKVKRIFPIHSPMIDRVEVNVLQRAIKANVRYLTDVKSPEKSIRAKKSSIKVKEI
jgi:large subunit ribosomal protein L19